MKTSILQFHRQAPALLEEGRYSELCALAEGLSEHDEESAFLAGLAAANLGRWEMALAASRESFALEPSEHARTLTSEALVRLGRNNDALALLRDSHALNEDERHRLEWLQCPGQRLASLEEVGAVLHPLYGTEPLGPICVNVRGDVPKQYLEAISEFHQREFPASRLSFVSTHSTKLDSFEALRDLVDVGQLPDWVTPDQYWLIMTSSDRSTGYSAGVGVHGVAVVKLEHRDPFAPTIMAHELYHSLLGLNHTNGTEGPYDPASIMGPLGTRTPLQSTYISATHRRCCTTQPDVQHLVEQKRLREALSLDPDYLGLYRMVAEELRQGGSVEEAVSVLEGWFERDPGPEAAAVLGRSMTDLGRSPIPVYEQTRGYDSEANTHLYLAQAGLEAQRYQEALQELDTALILAPGNLFGLAMRARAYRALGHLRKAAADYEAALEICPGWEAMRDELSLL